MADDPPPPPFPKLPMEHDGGPEQRVAFLVIYPTGGLGATFRPDQGKQADERARQLRGYLVGLPVLADYAPEKLRSAYAGDPGRPTIAPSINATPEPADGSDLIIVSGSREGRTFHRRDRQGEQVWGVGTANRWWDVTGACFLPWIAVQQAVGEASWTLKGPWTTRGSMPTTSTPEEKT